MVCARSAGEVGFAEITGFTGYLPWLTVASTSSSSCVFPSLFIRVEKPRFLAPVKGGINGFFFGAVVG